MPDVTANKAIYGYNFTFLSLVSGVKGSIMDKDATETIAEMRGEGEMGRERRKRGPRLDRMDWNY